MAFLHKIFQRQNSRKAFAGPGETKQDWKKPQFDEKEIRLVLFLDSDSSGRKILFDSKAVVKEEEKTGRWNISACKLSAVKEGKVQDGASMKKNQPTYQPSRTGSDSKWLEEMMFGAEGVAYKGKSLKVHVIRSPPQLMLTKVFIPEKPKRLSSIDSESLPYSYSSSTDLGVSKAVSFESRSQGSNFAQSVPVDVPISHLSLSKSLELMDEDSGRDSLNSSGSYQQSSPSSSYSSLPMERRLNRSQTHSFGSLGSMKRRSSMQDSLGVEAPVPLKLRKGKMALGIIFGTMDEKSAEANRLFEKFFFSHIALFEGHLEKIRLDVEKAYYTGKWNYFLTGMNEAFDKFKESISDLYTARRLSDPIWLNMMSYSSYRYMLCEKFLREFVTLASKYDGKNTNYFMSTLVTAVLTHHLAWVPTVVPAGGKPSDTYLEKHSAKWVDTLAKSHPYNPLWAQLSDLYGAIGFPLKLSRTIVVGKKADLVKKLLYILSYFIRCSDILENSEMGSLDSYITEIEQETPCDSEKSFVPITPTPTGDSHHRLQSPHRGSPGFYSLPLDSLLSECETDSRIVKQGASHSESQCEQCRNRRTNEVTQNRVGKSVFYVDDMCMCSVLRNKTDSILNGASVVKQCDYEIQKKKNSLNLSLKLIDKESSGSSDKLTLTESGKSSVTTELTLTESGKSSVTTELTLTESGKSSVTTELTLTESNEGKSGSLDNLTDSEKRSSNILNLTERKDSSNKLTERRDNSERLTDSGNSSGTTECESNTNSSELKITNGEINGAIDLPCKMSIVDIVKDPVKANVQHVMRSSDFLNTDSLDKNEGNKVEEINPKTKEIRAIYLKEGSDSMFDEYFEDETVTKTIDDLKKEDILVDLVSISKQRYPSGTNMDDVSNKAPSLPDLVSGDQVEDVKNKDDPKSPRSRLGSWDPTLKNRKLSFSRQISETSKNVPGRCRPITPTELGKRRHVSSTSSVDMDFSDPRAFCRELPMPSFDPTSGCVSQKETEKNFGRSLLADYSDHYMSDFVLLGTSDKNFQEKLDKDLRMSTQYSVLDEPIAEALCIIADTDKWTVHTHSSQHLDKPNNDQLLAEPSLLITTLINTVQNMWKLKMSPEFCIMHLEDRLQEIYFKSKMLAEYIKRTRTKNIKELQDMFGFDVSDLPLLMAIAGTHTPNVPLVYLS